MQTVHSQLRRNRFCNSLGQIGVLAGLFLALVASSDALAAYEATNLVSDIPGAAKRTDANLVNPWGIAVGSSGTIWVANIGTGMQRIHTVHEWLRVSDMVRTAAVIVEMVRMRGAGG